MILSPHSSIFGRVAMLVAIMMIAAAGSVSHAQAQAAKDGFLLIDRGLETRSIGGFVIEGRALVHHSGAGDSHRVALDDCIGLMRFADTTIAPRGSDVAWAQMHLVLCDGQHLPGKIDLSAAPRPDMLAWLHPWLGTLEVSLEHVSAVTLRLDEPVPAPGTADVVVLTNGDRLEGFVSAIGEPIAIEVDLDGQTRIVEIPLARAASVALISPKREPIGRRIWFRDGTTVDAPSLNIGDDGFVRLSTAWTDQSEQPAKVRLADIMAILFDPGGMIALGSLKPARVETNAIRYVLPAPRVLDEHAALGLGRIDCRGPVIIRYALPEGTRRFAAEAHLPASSRDWGDLELIIRDDEREVYRERINADIPSRTINVPVHGSELTIELAPGANGPIQDHLVLVRAMLLTR